ncbi:MAG: flagellar hook-length control protein FliK [Azoarcus sp.]|jgi:flagellar hook-length control protein FliK|nr:flagellar hook-length control protein FliK [Azoarcus sp.]
MATPVSSGTLSLSASSAAANPDISRNAGNGLLNLNFSDLLRGQVQSGIDARPSELPSLANVQPARGPSPPEAPRASGDSSATDSRHPSPLQEPAREPVRASGQNNPPEGKQTVKRPDETQPPPPPHADPETGDPVETSESAEAGEKEKTAGNNTTTGCPLQPQLADIVVSPDLPATIAALLSGIAGEIAEDVPENESAPGASAQGTIARSAGHPLHPEASGSLPVHTAASTAMQADMGMEDNAGSGSSDGQGTNPNTSAPLTGRPLRHPVSADGFAALSGTGKELPARINACAVSGMMTNATNALPAASREGGGAPTVQAGITANAGDISMLNPPRVSMQAGAALPQFTIPAGAGQRAWAEEIGNRVMWMLGRAESRAELILTPPLLGKVEVSIHLSGDQGTARFLASSQPVREALEQAMPRLRELLEQAGISLGEASVDTSAEDRAQDGELPRRAGVGTTGAHDIHDDNGGATGITLQNWPRLDHGLVNTFA